MIYRILVDFDADDNQWLPDQRKWNWQLAGYGDWPRTLQGVGGVFGGTMFELGPPAPSVTNPRARFNFTEDGWDAVGRRVAEIAGRNGHTVSVIRRKNPDRSQIVYADRCQVAVLPRKLDERRRRRPRGHGDGGT